jgi:Nuclease-related domain.
MVDESGVAGASARREHERRRARDEKRIREEWGRFGNLAVALTPEKQSTRSWSTGAVGEELVGQRLDLLSSDTVRVLHDRRIPGSRGNIDHIVVTAEAVWVIDTKRYKGRPSLRVEGGLFRPRVEKLVVNGRDKTPLVGGVEKQIAVVSATVPGVPVRGVLCFVEADWPLVGGDFAVRGIDVLWPRKLASRLAKRGAAHLDVATIAELISRTFRAA